MRRLKAAAGLLGFDPSRVEVLIYQLVSVVEHGEAKRMSKRRGDVVFLEELLEKIGVDAARWYLVSRGHDQPIEIDVDLAAEQTQKNPVYYVQYAHARIAGIMRNAGEAALLRRRRLPSSMPEERDLVKRLVEFPGVVAEATERRAAARAADVRDPRRRRLPPLLPPPPRRSRRARRRPSGSALCRRRRR